MNEFFGAGVFGLLVGVLIGALIGTMAVINATNQRLSTKHCQHIESRFEFEKCTKDFLGDGK